MTQLAALRQAAAKEAKESKEPAVAMQHAPDLATVPAPDAGTLGMDRPEATMSPTQAAVLKEKNKQLQIEWAARQKQWEQTLQQQQQLKAQQELLTTKERQCQEQHDARVLAEERVEEEVLARARAELGGKLEAEARAKAEATANAEAKAREEAEARVPWVEWTAAEIEVKELLGKGGFGEVRRVVARGAVMAAKYVNPASKAEEALTKNLLLKEVRKMAQLPHKHIVRLMGVCVDSGKMCILMEYMQRGSLRQVLDNEPELPLWRCFRILDQIVQAMAYAHAHKPHAILHRDLKAANILLDENYRAAVADMGLATGAGTLTKTTTAGGTMAYDAPEVLGEDEWTTKGNVFSFGVLAWETLTTKVPWAGSNLKQILTAVIMKEKRVHGRRWDEGLSVDEVHDLFFAELIKDCWAQEGADRPSFEELQQRFDCACERFVDGTASAQDIASELDETAANAEAAAQMALKNFDDCGAALAVELDSSSGASGGTNSGDNNGANSGANSSTDTIQTSAAAADVTDSIRRLVVDAPDEISVDSFIRRVEAGAHPPVPPGSN
jgi:serine/threonine protein kinase